MLVTDTNNYMVIATYTCTYLVASLIIDRYYAKYSFFWTHRYHYKLLCICIYLTVDN